MPSQRDTILQFYETANMRRIAGGSSYWWTTGWAVAIWGLVGGSIATLSALRRGAPFLSHQWLAHTTFGFGSAVAFGAFIALMPRIIRVSDCDIAVKGPGGKWRFWNLNDISRVSLELINRGLVKVSFTPSDCAMSGADRVAFILRTADAEKMKVALVGCGDVVSSATENTSSVESGDVARHMTPSLNRLRLLRNAIRISGCAFLVLSGLFILLTTKCRTWREVAVLGSLSVIFLAMGAAILVCARFIGSRINLARKH